MLVLGGVQVTVILVLVTVLTDTSLTCTGTKYNVCHLNLVQSTSLNPIPVNPSTRLSLGGDSIVNILSQHCHHQVTTLLMN